MSDIYIPGVKSKYDTEKIIEGLMKVERVRKESAEDRIEVLENEKNVWQDLNRRVGSLRESARSLFSYQSPFSERVAVSSNENALSASATRSAIEAEHSFRITRPASADRFLSKALPSDFQIPAGDYGFRIGDTKIDLAFRGGGLRDFAEALNRRGQDKLRASSLTVEPGTNSLVLESLLTGSANQLSFAGASESLVIDIGLAERIDDSERHIQVEEYSALAPNSTIKAENGVLSAGPESAARVPLGTQIPSDSHLIMELEIRTVQLPYDAPEDVGPPKGPILPPTGSIVYGGISIQSAPSSVPLPPWQPPEAPRRVDDMEPLSLIDADGTELRLGMINDSETFQTLRYNLADLAASSKLLELQIKNDNTHRIYELRNIRIFDPETRGAFRALQPITVASDAAFSMDGIEIKRPTNIVDDLIPGVTLNIQRESDETITLEIRPDRETAKDAIIALIGNYNRLVGEINVLTRQNDEIIDELSYLTEDERETLSERLGTMVGDSTLNDLKSKLQRIANDVYITRADRDLSLLAHIGVSTNSGQIGSGSGLDMSRLRGYLEIKEDALDRALKDNMEAVRDLFGNDTDGDLIVDNGVAYRLDATLKPYVETGGIFSLKTSTVDSVIAREKRTVESEEKRLASYEIELKRKYGQMESALNRMESSSSSIDNFMKQNKE